MTENTRIQRRFEYHAEDFDCYYCVYKKRKSKKHKHGCREETCRYEDIRREATENGMLNQVCEQAKKNLGVETIEAVADKGYESREDILDCLMNGTVPNVGLKYDKDVRIYNLEYEETENIDELKHSTKPEDIKNAFTPEYFRSAMRIRR